MTLWHQEWTRSHLQQHVALPVEERGSETRARAVGPGAGTFGIGPAAADLIIRTVAIRS